ncbi:MAG: S41 family peptidase, partial [Vulcanimicrobiaceae bacterium]
MAKRAQILSAAGKALGTYFFRSRIPRLRAALEAHRASLLEISDPRAFAKAVTADLYAAAHDKHVAVFYTTTTIPVPSTGKPTSADIAYIKHDEAFGNYGYASALRLWGNVGYLRLYFFSGMPEAKRTIDAAMGFLSHTDALIIDLRDNQGGNAASIDYLMGYFFRKPTELTSIIWRQNQKIITHRQFSAATVGAARYLGRPLYVLTDQRTISGGEQFAYDMQALRRATLIGASGGSSKAATHGQFKIGQWPPSCPDGVYYQVGLARRGS